MSYLNQNEDHGQIHQGIRQTTICSIPPLTYCLLTEFFIITLVDVEVSAAAFFVASELDAALQLLFQLLHEGFDEGLVLGAEVLVKVVVDDSLGPEGRLIVRQCKRYQRKDGGHQSKYLAMMGSLQTLFKLLGNSYYWVVHNLS